MLTSKRSKYTPSLHCALCQDRIMRYEADTPFCMFHACLGCNSTLRTTAHIRSLLLRRSLFSFTCKLPTCFLLTTGADVWGLEGNQGYNCHGGMLQRSTVPSKAVEYRLLFQWSTALLFCECQRSGHDGYLCCNGAKDLMLTSKISEVHPELFRRSLTLLAHRYQRYFPALTKLHSNKPRWNYSCSLTS